MPIYKIEEEGQPTRVVRAVSSSQAAQHVMKGRLQITNLKTADAVADIAVSGFKIEVAGDDEPAAPVEQRVDGDEPVAPVAETVEPIEPEVADA